MSAKIFKALMVGLCFAVMVSVTGCERDMEPEGPELGELEAYLNEHPELMETADEEMDYVDGDEFADSEG